MDVVRTALLVVVCVLAVAGTVLFFGSGAAELTPDEKMIAGRWTGDTMDLELGDTGRYALVVGTSGGIECGKWRVDRGSLQMRAKSGATAGSTLLMTQPGFRAGAFTRTSERLDVKMQTALPGERSRAENWALSRANGTLLDGCR